MEGDFINNIMRLELGPTFLKLELRAWLLRSYVLDRYREDVWDCFDISLCSISEDVVVIKVPTCR